MANKKRLIDANKTMNSIVDLLELAWGYDGIREDVQQIFENAETVDAVPVVRCRECVHWKPTGSKAGNSFSDMEYIGGCEFTNYCRRESDFCSHGERKDGDENG